MKRTPSHALNAVLAGGVLYYALHLSRGDRGMVDFVVIGLVCAAIAWNVVRLGLRLNQAGGGKALWHLGRTLLFWAIAIVAFVRAGPEAVAWLVPLEGWLFAAIAAADTVALYLRERAEGTEPPGKSTAA